LKNANAHVGLGKVRLGQDMIVQGRELWTQVEPESKKECYISLSKTWISTQL
jgi:hypothetical protein